MKLKNYQVFFILLTLAPLQCFEFIPNWTIFLYCILLFLRFFTTFHQFIILPTMWIASYFILKEYHFRLQPESAVCILNFMIMAKLLQKSKNYKTYYSLGFLWIGTFALFNTNLYYLFYLILFLLLMFNIMPHKASDYFKISTIDINKKTLVTFLKALPLILLLFFIFPRFYGFFPSVNNQSVGQIGYTTEINNSSFSSLSTNGKIAFFAEIDKIINPSQLYWRGRVLTQTDGYNWSSTSGLINKNPIYFKNNFNTIEYKMKYEQSFAGDIILLDSPVKINNINLRYYKESQYHVFKTYQKKKKAILSAKSIINSSIQQKNILKKKYLQLPKFIPKSVKQIAQTIKADTPDQLLHNFKKYLKKEEYVYTLSPGVMRVMNDFIKNRKGYCTHFASLLGIILRMNNIPTRLISGFQGGKYNELGKYYIINSNDAHAWVEYYHNKSWKRVDPTEYVSPFRITQGGDAFLTQAPIEFEQNAFIQKFTYIKKYISNLNYKLALFMDNFDRSTQKKIAQKFKISLNKFYLIGSAIFFLIMIVFFIFRNKKNRFPNKIDYYFYKFSKKCKKKGLKIKLHATPKKIEDELIKNNFPEDYVKFIKEYSKRRYGANKDINKLKEIISQI